MLSAGVDGGPVVVVVEDNQDLLALYEMILTGEGYRVAGAADGQSGLSLVRSLRPDIVLLDMMMPDMDGLAFLEHLPSSMQPVPPVVVCSGFGEFEPHARERGAQAFLRKPVRPDDLLAALGRTLAGRAEPQSEREQAARVVAGREQARAEREQILSRVDLDAPDLRAMLEGVLAWLSRYAGFGTGLVDLLCGDRIFVAAGAPERIFIDRGLAYCSDVVDAGSSLVIPDVAVHPVFADHRAAAYWGTRFYVGSPLVTSDGCVLGTICLIDKVPRRFAAGDMHVLERLASRIGAHFEALSQGRRPEPFFEPPALFDRPTFELIAGDQLAAATGVDLVLVSLTPKRQARLAEAARALSESAMLGRFTAALWTAGTLAFTCNGAHPVGDVDRAVAGQRKAGRHITAAGVAEGRPATGKTVSLSLALAAAERARAQSAAEGGRVVRVEVPV